MKEIYFGCSIRGGRDEAEIYKSLIDYTKTKATVLSEIFADDTLTPAGSPGPSSEIYAKDMGWIGQAHGLIMEVTTPSLGVGYEIGRAEAMGKPILALFRDTGERKLSAMIDGSPGTSVVYYNKLSVAYTAISNFILGLEQKDA